MTAFFLFCIWDVPEQKASFPEEQKKKKEKENFRKKTHLQTIWLGQHAKLEIVIG